MVSSTLDLRAELHRLLSESPAAARARERSTFDRAMRPFGTRLVLSGAGNLGRKALAALRADGIEPLAFIDNNPALWGTSIAGIDVLAPAEGVRRYGDSATFCVTIWRGEGTDTMAQRRRPLLDAGCLNVIDFGALFWKYAERLLPHYSLDLPHRVLAAAEDVRKAFDLWHDDASRAEYVAQVRWRLWLDFDNLPPPVAQEIYFPADLITISDIEVFVDCGAYDGDTLQGFIRHSGGLFKTAFAFEADQANYRKLVACVERLPAPFRARIKLFDAALSDHAGFLTFSATGTAGSAVAAQGIRIESVTLDDALDDAPTWIKMDIEGSEPAALRGAARTIAAHAPVLSICVYHSQHHLWSIPRQIAAMHAGYRMYLRPFVPESWDLVCYAIPPQRLRT